MKLRNNQRGSILIESILVIPVFIGILYISVELSLLTLAHRITQWACYTGARMMLPQNSRMQPHPDVEAILKTIPLTKDPPRYQFESSDRQVTFSVTQGVRFLGHPYTLYEKITLYK